MTKEQQSKFDDKRIAISQSEQAVFLLTGLPLSFLQSDYVTLQMECIQQLVKIRTHIISDEQAFLISNSNSTSKQSSKPTLVIIHGFGGASMIYYTLFKVLIRHYRLVLID